MCQTHILFTAIAFDCHANCIVLIEQVLFGRLLVKGTKISLFRSTMPYYLSSLEKTGS